MIISPQEKVIFFIFNSNCIQISIHPFSITAHPALRVTIWVQEPIPAMLEPVASSSQMYPKMQNKILKGVMWWKEAYCVTPEGPLSYYFSL